MQIVIPIKQVPESSSVKIDPEKGTVSREGVQSIINPLDLYAIEAGVQLKEKVGGKVKALSMGPPKAEEAVREAVAMGCDDAILLSDKRFETEGEDYLNQVMRTVFAGYESAQTRKVVRL